ncbi:MAG: hypothetical protein KDA61_21580, partial [Planctomycetales bacterium]|nr:hypothetical protein [Planctomycetales bacterium]
MLRTDGTDRIAEPLLALAPEADIVGDARVPIRRCTSRIDELRRGDLFAAVVDGEGDGHDDTAEAVARGAAAILGERYVPTPGVPQMLVADSAATYARICQQLAGFPSREIKVVGVTGTRGKTTTAVLIQAVL